jgi:hypothetical protein
VTNSVTIPSAGAADTITVARDLCNAFLADFTRNNRGAHAQLEVLGPDVGYQVEIDIPDPLQLRARIQNAICRSRCN